MVSNNSLFPRSLARSGKWGPGVLQKRVRGDDEHRACCVPWLPCYSFVIGTKHTHRITCRFLPRKTQSPFKTEAFRDAFSFDLADNRYKRVRDESKGSAVSHHAVTAVLCSGEIVQ